MLSRNGAIDLEGNPPDRIAISGQRVFAITQSEEWILIDDSLAETTATLFGAADNELNFPIRKAGRRPWCA